jgi:hypothetical protein
MKVNLNGAATASYLGLKELLDYIEQVDEDEELTDVLEDLNNIIVKSQPLLAAYCIYEHFNGESVTRQDEVTEALKELVSIVEIHSKATGSNFAWAELDQAKKVVES